LDQRGRRLGFRESPARPGISMNKVSVCMATYNGRAFAEAQLASILRQLRKDDELIVVDDNSKDDTLRVIDAIGDARIKVFINKTNLGVVKAFERAIREASGDIIFLSDQDDLWLENKTEKVLGLFMADPELTLVLSDAQIIDSEGAIVSSSFFTHRGGFRAGVLRNALRNGYLGCSMAFRRKMLEYFMPIPPDIPMHDMWIGIVNDIFGKTAFIDEPLIQYRRHGNNATSPHHAGLRRMLCWRASLLKNIALLLWRNKSKWT